jgi:predicted DNA binding CopG/RHH family protein
MTKIEKHQETIKPIAPFTTIEEEAEYWDTHSVVDEINQGTAAGFHINRKSGTLTIRFQPEHIQRIREEANQQGIGPTTLARMWILEHMQEIEKKEAHTGQGSR